MSVQFTKAVPKTLLDAALDTAPAHMRPILLATRDHGCAWAVIQQRAGRFDIPKGKPVIAIIGDDMHAALGPGGFHRKSVRRLLQASRIISIVASEAIPLAYAAAAAAAMGLRLNATIIETRPDQEMQWLALVRAENPSAQLIICSTRQTAQ